MRKQQIELLSMLNRWYQVKEDLLFAFEKCVGSGIGEPTRSYVNDFIVRVKGGLRVDKALDLLSESYRDSTFRYFIRQIRFNLKYRGNTAELLDDLESQFMRIEEEHTRRKIESSHDRIILKGLFILTPVVAFAVLLANGTARELFLQTTAGKAAACFSAAAYAAGLALYGTSHRSTF